MRAYAGKKRVLCLCVRVGVLSVEERECVCEAGKKACAVCACSGVLSVERERESV